MHKSLPLKLRLIYFPFLCWMTGMVCAYTFLNWLLFIRLQVFPLREEIRNMWIPFCLPWIPLLIWFRPRVKLLKFRNETKDPSTNWAMLASFAIIAPLVISQQYLSTATGTLTALTQVKEMDQAKQTRYYTLRDYTIDKGYTRSYLNRTVSGKHDEFLEVSLYIVCPLYDKDEVPQTDNRHYPISDTGRLYFLDGELTNGKAISRIPSENIANINVLKGRAALSLYGLAGKNGVVMINTKKQGSGRFLSPDGALPDSIPTGPAIEEDTKITPILDLPSPPRAWIGVKYTKNMSNRQQPDIQQQQISDFEYQSWLDYLQSPRKGFTYFDEIPYNEDYTYFHKAVQYKNSRFHPKDRLRLLEPKNESFESRNGKKLPWIVGSFAIGAALYFLCLLFVSLDDTKVNAWLSGHPTPENTENGFINFLNIFSVRKGFFVTPLILYANLAVFIAMVIAGLGFLDFNAADLVAWGGNYGPYTANGQWWRLLTSIFLHGGLMHLLLNMYALLFVGIFLEPVLGKKLFAICYFVTGILASLASVKIHPDTVSVGASGAIFGMYGVFLAFLLAGVFPPSMRKAFLASTLIFIGYNLIQGLQGHVDNAAHIGGLLCGWMAGLLISRSALLKKETESSQ